MFYCLSLHFCFQPKLALGEDIWNIGSVLHKWTHEKWHLGSRSWLEQRTIFRQVTIFRHLFLISCNFCIFHRNRFISFMPMKSKYIFTQQIKEMVKVCFNMLKLIVVKYGEIWFPWRNMVLCSKGETITRVSGNVSFFAGKHLQNF